MQHSCNMDKQLDISYSTLVMSRQVLCGARLFRLNHGGGVPSKKDSFANALREDGV